MARKPMTRKPAVTYQETEMKVYVTEDYSIFVRSDFNRQTVLEKHQGLIQSMQIYGFIRGLHILCEPEGEDGKFVVKDGQYRLAAAEYLGLPVYWAIEEVDFNIALINNAQKTWHLINYAEMYATHGVQPYQDGLDFMEKYGLAPGIAFTLLAGASKITQKTPSFIGGRFKIVDQAQATLIAETCRGLVDLAPRLQSTRIIEACIASCRIEGFNIARLVANAKKCPEKLRRSGTQDECLDMFEDVYNYNQGAKSLLGLRTAAKAAVRLARHKPRKPAKSKKRTAKRPAKRTAKRTTKRSKRAK